MHVPLNIWKGTLGYGRLTYLLIGVGVPVVFTIAFNRFLMMRRLFGLPKIMGLSVWNGTFPNDNKNSAACRDCPLSMRGDFK